MCHRWCAGLTAALLLVAGILSAQDPVPVADAADVASSVPAPAADAVAPNGVLTPEQVQLLNQKISIDLIDVERLREAVDSVGGGEPIQMSLVDCIQLALENNPDLLVVRMEPLKSDADILTARGEFDPLLRGTASYVRSQQQASPEYKLFGNITAYDVYRTTTKTSVGGKLRWGTMYDVSMDLNKEETTFNNFIEQWSGGLTLTLTQPLLRGRGAAANLARVRMAKNARNMTELQLKLAVMNTLAEVVKAYWDLVGAIESLAVRQQALANAERLLDISTKRLEIGTGAAIEVLQAKAGVATRQSDLISARSTVSDAEDVLKQVLNLRDGGRFSHKRLTPTDRPKVTEFDINAVREYEKEIDQSIDKALETRPELLMGQLEIDSAKIDRTRAANDLLPKLDIMGSVFQGKRDHYMTGVFDGIRTRDDNYYTFGVEGSIPIGNRAARGQFERASVTLHQAEQKLEKTKQEVMLKVRLALRALHTSQILVESNQQAATLQETNVAAEEKRLQLGVSTSYRVLQIQQDLTLAQTQELSARIAFEKALVDLRLAEGGLLESLGIEFAPPEPERPVSFVRSVNPLGVKD